MVDTVINTVRFIQQKGLTVVGRGREDLNGLSCRFQCGGYSTPLQPPLPLMSDSDIDKKAQVPLGREEG